MPSDPSHRERPATASPPTRFGRIARREVVTPNVIQVTVAGIDGLTAAVGDEHWFVLATKDGSAFPVEWSIADYRDRSEGNPIIGAYYTTRRARPDAGEVDLWVVQHDHPSGAGALLQRAPTGATVAVWGPRRSFTVPVGVASVLLVADETGTAAVAALIEGLPATTRVAAVLETVDAAHQLPLPAHPGLNVRWVDRGAVVPGGASAGLLAAVRELCSDARPEVAFGAAESRRISAVRRLVRRELGLPAGAVHMSGYWRRVG